LHPTCTLENMRRYSGSACPVCTFKMQAFCGKLKTRKAQSTSELGTGVIGFRVSYTLDKHDG